jgi:hypothetical protein
MVTRENVMKKLTTVRELNSALAKGLVSASEPDGTYRYLTTRSDVLTEASRSFISNSPGFDNRVETIVFNLLDGKAETIQPTLYNGVMMSLEVTSKQAEEEPDDFGAFIEGVNTPVYVAGTIQEAEIVDKVGGLYPFLVRISKPDGDVLITQVDAKGISRDGRKIVLANPHRNPCELIVDIVGVLMLTKEKGPLFISAALSAGLIRGEAAPEISMTDGSVAMSAIQRVHRDHGVLGYDLGQEGSE